MSKDESGAAEVPDELRLTCKRRRISISSSTEDESCSSDASCNLLLRSTIGDLWTESEDTESEDDIDDKKSLCEYASTDEWQHPDREQPCNIPFAGSTFAVNTNLEACSVIQDFFSILVTDEIFEIIANQTNVYAMQKRSKDSSQRLNAWHPTNKNEIKRFFGLVMWMGLVRLPKVCLYWSKDKMYMQTFPCTVMSKNRFELLLRMLHFSNDEEADKNDHLSKIKSIINLLNQNFQKYYNPDEVLCIHESLIPFREHMGFKEYLKLRRHNYGIKLFKLCCGPGYTYNFCLYGGRNSDMKSTILTNTLMSLCKNVLGKGHTICTDSAQTNINLADRLLSNNTYLVGALRRNYHGIPKEVKSKELRQGEFIVRENTKGITVLKWKDKQDILMLSTKYLTKTELCNGKWNSCYKPRIIADYNLGKASVDLSDQMAMCYSALSKTLKWYKKLAFVLLLNISVINSLILFQKTTHNRISMIECTKKLAVYLTHHQDDGLTFPSRPGVLRKKLRHEIKRKEGQARKVRQFCKSCYKKNVGEYGRDVAKNCTKKVTTFCEDCDDKPHLCLPCFNMVHHNMSL